MRPLLSYYGGKQRMASKIIPLIPKHTVYVEPFCGGASILFAKPVPPVTNTDHYREVINDISDDLINFYRCAVLHASALAERIKATLFSESDYRLSRHILNRVVPANDLLRAWAYYVNTQQSFANKVGGGWARNVFNQNRGCTWSRSVANFDVMLRRVSSLYVAATDDALQCIRQWDSPQTFFYVDPPYVGTDCGHYKGYTEQDLQKLLDLLDSCQGAFILSSYPLNSYFTLPRDCVQRSFATTSSASGKGKTGSSRSKSVKADSLGLGDRARTEMLYMRGRTKPLRDSLVKVLQNSAFDCFAKGDALFYGEGAERQRQLLLA